jgi:surface carbohydrate biosynthesis protein
VHFEIASFPRGIYLAKSLRRLSERMFGILRDLGHDIVAWDEEALVHLSDVSFYYEQRLSPKTMRQISALFAWGDENVELFRNYSGYSGALIHATGNVRIDMMRPELRNYFAQEIEKIRKRFDRFILINTNFGWNNRFLKRLRMDQPEGRPKSDFEAGLAEHKIALFEGFKQMVPAVAEALPDFTIVVRPHPTEDHDLWNKLGASTTT